MGDGCHVLDERHFQTRRVEGPNGRFPTRTGSLHPYLNASNAVFHRRASAGFGGLLGGKGCALPRPRKAYCPARSPRNRIASFIGDGHNGVIECRLMCAIPLVTFFRSRRRVRVVRCRTENSFTEG